jgi:hypothetical protein
MLCPSIPLQGRNVLPDGVSVKQGLAALAVALLGIITPVEARAAASCHIPGGRTVASGAVAKLISVPSPRGAALFACIRRSGRKVVLDDSYRDARLAGRWVAWQRAGRPGHRRIAVEDLRNGRSRLVNGHVASHSLGLTARGTIVWAQEQDAGLETPLYVNEAGLRGGRLLDGGAVDANSVLLAGRRVTWLSGGEQHHAIIR